MGIKPQRIELHIEELVLHGFAPGDRYRIGEAVERELTRLFAEQGVPVTFAYDLEAGYVDAQTFHVAPHANAEAIGAQVAQRVYGVLSR